MILAKNGLNFWARLSEAVVWNFAKDMMNNMRSNIMMYLLENSIFSIDSRQGTSQIVPRRVAKPRNICKISKQER